MTNFLRKFQRDEGGASAAEYALILAIAGAGIATATLYVSDTISNAMTNAAECIEDPAANCAAPAP